MISIFANKRGSGELRGRQVAEALGARLNPKSDYADDVCVWVKKCPPEDFPARSYLDVVDASERVSWLRRHPEIGVIASSLSGHRFLEKTLGRAVKYIPQHHCNIERHENPDRPIKVIGVVGGKASVPPFLDVAHYKPRNRKETVEAYKQIDIQIIWRGLARPLKNFLKIVNAAAFGEPTVALPEPGYEEMEGLYAPVNTEEQALRAIYYWRIHGWDRKRLMSAAEPYHLDHIKERYLEL